MFEFLRNMYKLGKAGVEELRVLAETGTLTPEQFEEITGQEYPS